jgi:hypothetical protein
MPWYWLGLARTEAGHEIRLFDYQTGSTLTVPIDTASVWLRVECDFLTEEAQFSFSLDGTTFAPLGERVIMVFQLKTFQGIRFALFSYNDRGEEGGYADFDRFEVDERYPRGLMHPLPTGQSGALVLASAPEMGLAVELGSVVSGKAETLRVEGIALGRVILHHADGPLSVTAGGIVTAGGLGGVATHWQWMETPTGEVLLMSLATNRFLRIHADGVVRADSPGPTPDGQDGTRFRFSAV